MADTPDGVQIHTQERGPHWISWITRGGSDKPEGSIVLVAATQAEAEARARAWATRNPTPIRGK